MTASIYIPFTYLIGWSIHNKWYYGVRWCKTSNPRDLWTTYYTSSKYVNQCRLDFGEPDIIQIRKTFNSALKARTWESKVLRRLNAVDSDKWVNKGNAGEKFCFIKHTAESKQKLSKLAKGKTISEEHKLKISQANSGRQHTLTSKAKIREARMKQTNVGLAWTRIPFTEQRRQEFRERSLLNYSRPGLEELKLLIVELKSAMKFNKIPSNIRNNLFLPYRDIIYNEYCKIFNIDIPKPNTVKELYNMRNNIIIEVRPTRNWHLLATNEYISEKIKELQHYVMYLKQLHIPNSVWYYKQGESPCL